jgi:hypothetical protein
VRQSRRWIEAELDALAGGEATLGDGIVRAESCAQVTLSPQEVEALKQRAAAAGLDREVVLARLISAALAGPEDIDLNRFDRHRLRRCIDLLRAIEVHIARAARSMSVRQLPPEVTGRRLDELLNLGRYLRRVGSVLSPRLRGHAAAKVGPGDARGDRASIAHGPASSDP